ncbi:hypothetical protein ACLOJK_036267 [Asimina triloba]
MFCKSVKTSESAILLQMLSPRERQRCEGMMSEKQQRVLVVGGSGYLGQHLLQSLSAVHHSPTFDLAFTYNSFPPQQLLDSISPCLSFRVDLLTGQGFDSIAGSFGQDVAMNDQYCLK